MRIKDRGYGGFFDPGQSRSDSFRRKHRVGQKVEGTLIRYVPDSLAVVEIDGERLFAQVSIRRAEGSRLQFIIKQLVPDIVLKEITLAHSTGTSALGLVASFDTARTLFENFLSKSFKKNKRPAAINKQKFLKLLAENPELLARYQDAVDCAQALTQADSTETTFLYQPWLALDSRRQITCIRRVDGSLLDFIIEFDHTSMGLVRLEFLRGENGLSCKAYLQHPRHASDLAAHLRRKSGDHDIHFLGATKLRKNNRSGIIAETIFQT